MAGILDFLQSASNATASTVSVPVDILAWALRKAGLPIPENAVGGSQWMEEKGLTRPVEQSAASLAGETAANVLPIVAAAKAPQIARGILQAGENALAPTTLSKEAGIFVGPNAQGVDLKALREARRMATYRGEDPLRILDDTGWFQGKDLKWRTELSDQEAYGLPVRGNAARGLHPDEKLSEIEGVKVLPFDEAFVHSNFERSYPEQIAEKLRYVVDPRMGKEGGVGMYVPYGKADRLIENPKTGEIDIEKLWIPGMISTVTKSGRPDIGTTLHEIQHFIQQIEGFARGSSPKSSSHSAMKQYMNQAGEVEARNVEIRRDWGYNKRKEIPPWVTEDVPREKQYLNWSDRKSGQIDPLKLAQKLAREGAAPGQIWDATGLVQVGGKWKPMDQFPEKKSRGILEYLPGPDQTVNWR